MSKNKTDEKRQKRYERNQLRKQMKDIIRSFVKENEGELPEEVTTALNFLVGKNREYHARTPAYMSVLNMIIENGKVSENDIWNEFKMGRVEMRNAIRKYIRKSHAGSEIHWIRFNEDEDYEVVDVSTTPPNDWTGALPVLQEDDNEEEIDL